MVRSDLVTCCQHSLHDNHHRSQFYSFLYDRFDMVPDPSHQSDVCVYLFTLMIPNDIQAQDEKRDKLVE